MHLHKDLSQEGPETGRKGLGMLYRKTIDLPHERITLTALSETELLMCKNMPIPRSFCVTDVIGDFWLLGRVTMLDGHVAYCSQAGVFKDFKKVHWIFKPPYSLATATSSGTHCLADIYLCRATPTFKLPAHACYFESDYDELPTSMRAAERILKSARRIHIIERRPQPSPLSRKLKHLLDEGFHHETNIASASLMLGVAQETLTRAFKSDFDITPLVYRNKLRISCAMPKLFLGRLNVLSAATELGFGDVGRFTKQFSKYTGSTPSTYKY